MTMAEVAPILIVDDDEDTRHVLSHVLSLRGYRTAEAATGAEALEYLRAGKPACCLILDLNLPDMNGGQVRAELKRDPAFAHLPVIIFSGMEVEKPIEDIVAHVRKGLDPEELLTHVERTCKECCRR